MVDRSRLARGAWGERKAAQWYTDEGYTVLDRNWRTRTGEIDLVVCRDGEIVFCEVKARRSDFMGTAAEAVDWRKQKRLRALAVQWLETHNRRGRIRFDVATVTGTSVGVIRAAF